MPSRDPEVLKRYVEKCRLQRAARRAAGLCVDCGALPVFRDRVRCFDCLRRNAARSARRYAKHRVKDRAEAMARYWRRKREAKRAA